LPYLDGVNLPELICQLSDGMVTEVTVENDAKAAALGEMKAGNLHRNWLQRFLNDWCGFKNSLIAASYGFDQAWLTADPATDNDFLQS